MIEQVVSYRAKCSEGGSGGEGDGGSVGGDKRCVGVSVELEKASEKRALLAPLADVVRQ